MKLILFTFLLALIFAIISVEAAATPATQADSKAVDAQNAAAAQKAKAAADKAKAKNNKNKNKNKNKGGKAKAANANAANANAAANSNANAANANAASSAASAAAAAAGASSSSSNNASADNSNVDNSNADNSNADNSNVDNSNVNSSSDSSNVDSSNNNNSLQDLLDQLLGNNNNNNNNNDNSNNDNLSASATSSAASATRTRGCDQGDISLAAGLTANVQIGLGEQASVVTIQGLLNNGSASDIQTAITRLQQFISTSNLQLQTCIGIADSGSFAQPQLALLQQEQSSQEKLVNSLTGSAADNAILDQLLTSFQASTDNSQDGANNALIDCFLPLTLISG